MTSPGPSPILSVADLAGRLGDPSTLVVDTRWYLGKPGEGRAAYRAGHIPGAIHLDLDADLADLAGYGAPGRHPLPSPRAFAARMTSVGIGDETFVVAYDDVGGWVAARFWWMLDNLGHRGGVAVLDGGWEAWVAAGQAVSTEVAATAAPVAPAAPVAAAVPSAAALHLADRWTGVISRDEVAARLGDLTLLDARAAERYRGETEPIDPVAGHIPTALSAPWDGNLGSDGRFLPAADLRRRFQDLATSGPAGAGAEVVTYCGSGTSALHHALAMRIAGLADPTLYVGSYSDWSRSGMPVAAGPQPGESGSLEAPGSKPPRGEAPDSASRRDEPGSAPRRDEPGSAPRRDEPDGDNAPSR
jgi:thiosulfate/3-mercaptopyruvate sulfurtransferase